MKRVTVVVTGAPENEAIREVDLQPGVSTSDLLDALNLQGYLLQKEGSGNFFGKESDLYTEVEDGTKLRASTTASVGA